MRRRTQMVQARQILENTTTRHNIIHNFLQPSSNTKILQSLHNSIIYKCYNRVAQFKRKTTHNYFSVQPLHNRSDRSVWRPPRSHRSDRSNQNRQVAPSARKCATQQTPSLRVSVHHLPPICITTDEFDTAGAEIHVRVS